MANFLKDLTNYINGEVVEAVEIIGLVYLDYNYKLDKWNADPRMVPLIPYLDKTISWEIVAPLLNFEYNDGYGSMDCPDLNIFTPTRVIYIHEYDGLTQPRSVPRNPKSNLAGGA